MDAEKRERRVGHRVNQTAHHVRPVGAENIVLATERHDAHFGIDAGKSGDPIALKTAAIDDQRGVYWTGGRLYSVFATTLSYRHHAMVQANLATQSLNLVRHSMANRQIVNHSRLRHP